MSLASRGVLVTRPAEQARALAALVERAGGRAFVFPALEIEPLPQPEPMRRLEEFDLAVFVSPTAVREAFRNLAAWPAGLAVFALGPGTQAELARRGVSQAAAPPAGADSEALLALPHLARLAGRRVLIVRGEGGRGLLGDTLAARGAHVEYAQCYRRVRSRADPTPLLDAFAGGEIDAVTVNSSEALESLLGILGAALERVRQTPLFVPHARVAALARGVGMAEVLIAGPADDQMLERLVAYFSHERKPAR